MYYGPDVDAALDWVRGFACTSAALRGADPAAALARLHDAIAAHATLDGVWFDARAWLVTARGDDGRPGSAGRMRIDAATWPGPVAAKLLTNLTD